MTFLGFRFTVLWLFFSLLSIAAALTLVFFLRKLTIEWASPEGTRQHWWRYTAPSVVAIGVAWFQGIRLGVIGHWFYTILLGVVLPFYIVIRLIRESLQGKRERLLAVIALLLWVQVTFLTAEWYGHYRQAHGGGYNSNPHLTKRNGTLRPMWVLTILASLAAAWMWQRENRKENEQLLPSDEKPELP